MRHSSTGRRHEGDKLFVSISGCLQQFVHIATQREAFRELVVAHPRRFKTVEDLEAAGYGVVAKKTDVFSEEDTELLYEAIGRYDVSL